MHFAPTLQYAVCILYLVCSAHSVVCSLLFAVTYTNTVVFVVGIVWCCHARLFRDERAVACCMLILLGITTSRAASGGRGKDRNTSGQRGNNFNTSYRNISVVVVENNGVTVYFAK